MKKVIRRKLKNGIRILAVPRKESLTTTVGILVGVGSEYETRKTNGLSHFLEHMCFKGTERRPRAMDISAELDAMGAQYNAFTGYEYTSYYAKVQNKAFFRALDIVSDLYLNPLLKEEDIEIERGVITEEISMYEDMPHRKIQTLFMETLYGDQPAGWSILGPKKNIKSFTREDFVSYRSRNYLPEATVVLVSGNVDVREATRLVQAHFESLKPGKKMKKKKVRESQVRPVRNIQFKKLEQTHLMLGARAFGIRDERKYALEVLASILGGGMSSRLFKKIRDELGAAYYIHADADFLSDHGFLSVSCGAENKKAETVIRAILDEMKDLKERKVSQEEVKRAKEHLLGKLFMSAETSDALGYFYGFQEILGMDPASPREAARKIRAVSAEDVQKVARQVFRDSRLNLAVIGPFNSRRFGAILHV